MHPPPTHLPTHSKQTFVREEGEEEEQDSETRRGKARQGKRQDKQTRPEKAKTKGGPRDLRCPKLA